MGGGTSLITIQHAKDVPYKRSIRGAMAYCDMATTSFTSWWICLYVTLKLLFRRFASQFRPLPKDYFCTHTNCVCISNSCIVSHIKNANIETEVIMRHIYRSFHYLKSCAQREILFLNSFFNILLISH